MDRFKESDNFFGGMPPATADHWVKKLVEEAKRVDYFRKFRPPYVPAPWWVRVKHRISSKLEDIVAGLRIIFKGEYPEWDE